MCVYDTSKYDLIIFYTNIIKCSYIFMFLTRDATRILRRLLFCNSIVFLICNLLRDKVYIYQNVSSISNSNSFRASIKPVLLPQTHKGLTKRFKKGHTLCVHVSMKNLRNIFCIWYVEWIQF